MSLIGSLEDLGLGDILEIIHLSRKSGVLSIRGDAGEGRLVFQGGLVRLASLRGDPENLLELVVDGGFVTTDEFDKASAAAGESGCELSVAIANSTAVSLERIESLRRECIERAVGTMFSWSAGDFSFDVGAEDDCIESDMALSTGVNAQYLAMESLRIWDEVGRGQAGEGPGYAGAADESEQDFDLDMSAKEMFGVAESASEPTAAPNAVDSLVEATAIHVEPVLELDAREPSVPEASLGGGEVEWAPIAELIDPSLDIPLPSLGLTAFDLETGFGEMLSAEAEDNAVANEMPMSERVVQPAPTVTPQATPATAEQIQSPVDVEVPNVSSQPVVVIAPELSVLEWVRSSLSDKFSSVHIFQRSQEGLGRIRQYLARAQAPILLVSPRIEGNPLSGIVDAADFVLRLQGQAPRMPILWLVAQVEAEESLAPVALPSVIYPPIHLLARSGGAEGHEELSRQVGRMLINATAAHPDGGRKVPTFTATQDN
jgi:hypothetical protein